MQGSDGLKRVKNRWTPASCFELSGVPIQCKCSFSFPSLESCQTTKVVLQRTLKAAVDFVVKREDHFYAETQEDLWLFSWESKDFESSLAQKQRLSFCKSWQMASGNRFLFSLHLSGKPEHRPDSH